MLVSIFPLGMSNSRVQFNQVIIYPVHSQIKEIQQIILFTLKGKKGENPQWKGYKKPLK